jgi:hypothetical protein
LLSAGGEGLDKGELDRLMANLGNRVFLMRNVHEDAPVLLRTRWALSYLRGPLTLNEIQKLTVDTSTKPSPAPTARVSAGVKPMIPSDVKEFYIPTTGATSTYVPYVLGTVRAHFLDGAANVDVWQTRSYLAPLLDDGSGPDWSAAKANESAQDGFESKAANGHSYANAPAALLRAQNYAVWGKQLADHVYQTTSCDVLRCALLKLTSTPGEAEGDFRARIAMNLREKRDLEIDKLRAKYAPRITTITDQVRRAQERIAREQSQLSQQKVSAAISVGTAILGAFFGRKALSSTTLSRAGTAMRSAGRVTNESADVARAGESMEILQQRLAGLQSELESETARLQGELDPAVATVETTAIKARKSETVSTGVALVWVPV